VLSDGDRVAGVYLCPPAGVYMMGERARGRGGEGRKIGSSMFSDYNDIIFCDKTHIEQTIG
jgi:hypothetical protein